MLFAAIGTLAAPSAEAQLRFYYDPDTGNVALDTVDTRTGGIYSYALGINEPSSIRFRSEELISLTNSTFVDRSPDLIGEFATSTLLSGYFTIGDILPSGLSEMSWTSTFAKHYFTEPLYDEASDSGFHLYTDRPAGSRPDYWAGPAEFIYGQPDREFDNRWDLVDPDDLDWAESATLVYDPATGNVTIDTARGEGGGYTSWFILESEGGFLPDNFTPWIDSPFTSATTDLIGFAADAVEPGVYSAGSILAPGLTLEEVQSTFTSARFVSRAGFGGASFDFETDGLDFGFALAVAVPEPTAMVLISLAMIGFNAKRFERS